uniref:DUF2029 domain-containing protein n=1 Tax=Caldiarchaeum subterraneum TaxID=311458 RepID=E6N411_CALS0|nr:hypothetical protein HGMM_F55C09C26 [Candidatus Caldarchaeum subterraneum]
MGGVLEGVLSMGYGQTVQGIGETPLWALYNGFAYAISNGHIFLFNLVTKIPIILANIALSYLAYLRGCDAKFFLFNPFILLVTSSWGKPDNIATLLAVLPFLYPTTWGTAPLMLALSFMIKPLALPLLPSYVGKFSHFRPKNALTFVIVLSLVTLLMFLIPFTMLRWPLDTVINGLGNWLKPAGGLSLFNVVEIFTGSYFLPDQLTFLGLLAPTSVLLLMAVGFLYPPADDAKTLRLALFSCLVFFSLRPWVSEQNLFIILTLVIFLDKRLSSKLLWIIPLLFSVANLSLPQQLYLLRPSIIEEIHAVDNVARLWFKFILSIAWLAVIWRTAFLRGLVKWRECGGFC